jgi:hypothetical protein
MEGYFKVHRKILESQIFAHPIALKIWVWCLAKVTFKNRFVSLKIGKGYTTVELNPGQFLFGRFKAEEELNIDGSTIYKWMQKFSSEEFSMIKIESNNQYSVITINKWDEYQNGEDEEVTTKEQPSNNSVTTEEQQRNTNNNDNKDKNTNTWRTDFQTYLSECKSEYQKFMEDTELLKTQQRLNPGINVKLSIEKGFINFWGTEAGWKFKKGKKSKDINWKSTIINSISMNKVYYTKQELAIK